MNKVLPQNVLYNFEEYVKAPVSPGPSLCVKKQYSRAILQARKVKYERCDFPNRNCCYYIH